METHRQIFDFDDYNRRSTRYQEWDEQWGGECPWRKPDPEFEELRRKAGIIVDRDGRPVDVWKNPPLIDRVMPYILILGFLAFCFGLYGILDWLVFSFVPGVL